MTMEEMLKDLILSRYKSLREFARSTDIPYTTVYHILIRGVSNSSVGNVIKICHALNISVDELVEGRIVSKIDTTGRETKIEDIIDDTKTKLSYTQNLTLNGIPVDIESVESIVDTMEVGLEVAKRKKSHGPGITKTITKT